MNKLHFFIDEVSGVLKVITDMPEASDFVDQADDRSCYDNEGYESALKAAKKKALEVLNKDEVFTKIRMNAGKDWPGFGEARKQIHSLECNTIEFKENNCALITFSESKPMNEEKEEFCLMSSQRFKRLEYCKVNGCQTKKCQEFKQSIPPLPVEDKEEFTKQDLTKAFVAGLLNRPNFTTEEFQSQLEQVNRKVDQLIQIIKDPVNS